MFKKIIFTLLSFFYCINIRSNYQLSNNSDEQTIILLTIKNEINKLPLESTDKIMLNNIITKYLNSDKSINSYIIKLKELKNIIQKYKLSVSSKILLSTFSALVISIIIYYDEINNSKQSLLDNNNDIETVKKLSYELKQIIKEPNFIKKQDSLEKLIQFFNKEECLQFFNKINPSIYETKNMASLVNFIVNQKNIDHITNLRQTLDLNETYPSLDLSIETNSQNILFFDRYLSFILDNSYNPYSKYIHSFFGGLAAFVGLYYIFSLNNPNVDAIENVIDEAIQNAESILKN